MMKFMPKSFEEYIGDRDLIDRVKSLVEENKPVLLYGKQGVGKTSLAYLLAKELGYEVIEVNASDERTEEKINKLKRLATSKALTKTLFLFDEIDGAKINLIKILKSSHHPIILTANHLYKVPEEIKELCEVIEIKSPQLYEVLKKVKSLSNKELDYSKITSDIRSSILNVLYNGEKYTATDDLTFDKVRNLFLKGEVSLAKNSDLLWFIDNVENFYDGFEIYKVINLICEADRLGKIELLKYLPKGKGSKVDVPYLVRRGWHEFNR